ncbi:unnamed protein product [Litomosoides sigmodontis]|uniref:Uncharacterized protein n=1 Tax=Litomosoides sigmodontis TaxID=42156 RepID=A0A3P6RZG9_LITSI|nr:unnamed protein product [Litomosoides sigmodontis]
MRNIADGRRHLRLRYMPSLLELLNNLWLFDAKKFENLEKSMMMMMMMLNDVDGSRSGGGGGNGEDNGAVMDRH